MKNFLALLIFAAAGGGWYVYYQDTQAKKQIAEMTQNLPIYEQTVATRQAEVQAYSRMLDLQKKAQAKRTEVNAIVEKERTLKETVIRLAKEKSDIISRARQAFAGKVIPELTLADGRKLAQVKIIKVEENGLSVTLSSGVQKILPSELPENLRKSFHYR
ncbi:MAG: hypothetical protein V4599_00340 [Verrucomicrobiota bacterium]